MTDTPTLTDVQRAELADRREFVRELILANFTDGRYGYRLNPGKAADDVLDFLAPLVARMVADAEQRGRAEALRSPYDEDGYCEFCGNHCGKAHSPTCAWADLRDAKASAWDEGYSWCFGEFEGVRSLNDNPYRADRIGGGSDG